MRLPNNLVVSNPEISPFKNKYNFVANKFLFKFKLFEFFKHISLCHKSTYSKSNLTLAVNYEMDIPVSANNNAWW